MPAILERLARLEEAISGLRHSQNLIVALGAVTLAILVGIGIYSLQRLDTVSERLSSEGIAVRKEINDLRNVISSEAADTRKELIGITSAIANSITAARQPPPPQAPPERRR